MTDTDKALAELLADFQARAEANTRKADAAPAASLDRYRHRKAATQWTNAALAVKAKMSPDHH